MAARQHRHIALTKPLAWFIEWQVAQACDPSASWPVRAGLLIEAKGADARQAEEDNQAHG